jgi:hypothetical protein
MAEGVSRGRFALDVSTRGTNLEDVDDEENVIGDVGVGGGERGAGDDVGRV